MEQSMVSQPPMLLPSFEMVNATNVAANINTSDASKGFQVEKEQLITWNLM